MYDALGSVPSSHRLLPNNKNRLKIKAHGEGVLFSNTHVSGIFRALLLKFTLKLHVQSWNHYII